MKDKLKIIGLIIMAIGIVIACCGISWIVTCGITKLN